MDGTGKHVARVAPAMPFPWRVPKDQGRAKRFDKAARFTLKTKSQFRSNQLIQATGNPNDHKTTSDFRLHAVAVSACFFFTTSFGSFCRCPGSHYRLAATRGSRAGRRRLVSIK